MVCKAAPPLCWRVPCRWQSSHSSIFFGRKTAFRKAGSHPPRVLCRDGPCAHAHLPALTRCAATVGSRRPRGRAEGPPCGVAMVAGAVLAGVGGQPGPQVSGRGTSPPTAIPHWAVRCSLPRQSGLEALLRLRLPVRGRAEPGGLAVVVQLSDIRDVSVEEEKVRYFGKGHVVVLRFATGFSHPLTQSAVMGHRGDVEAIARLITTFLELHRLESPAEPSQSSDSEADILGDHS
uniref:Essential for reactive oxygen species protein n=1 Tax=Sus scrofa TaxID=9823 RepID=A0A8D1BY30_PIG